MFYKLVAASFLFLLITTFFSFNKEYIERQLLRTNEPEFSHEESFYTERINLKINSKKKNTQIVYTLDGASPSKKSNIYINPVEIDKTTVVKAQLMYRGELIGDVVTKTYFISHESPLPVISLIAEPSDLWKNPGIYGVNFLKTGEEWEIPAHFSFFEPGGKKVIDANLAMRIHGGTSRNQPQKSFRLCAKEKYGSKYIHYKMFETGQDNYRCLLFRNSGNDWAQTMIRDGTIQGIAEEMGLDTQRYRPAVLYINGEYYGIQNVREFYDEQYFVSKYGARAEQITVIRPRNRTSGYPEVDVGEAGSEQDYLDLVNFLKKEGAKSESGLQLLTDTIDIENLIDYMIFQIFVGNHDWPQNNTKLWKYNNLGDPNAPYRLDGRYRYLVYDTDHGLGYDSTYDDNSLSRASGDKSIPKHPWSTIVLEKVLENEELKVKFINRYADLLNTIFLPENVLNRIEKSAENVRPEIPSHIHRWFGQKDRNNRTVFSNLSEWEEKVDVMRTYAKERPEYAKQHIIERFGLSGQYRLELNTKGSGKIKVNSITISDYPKDLYYFKEIPITLEAYANFGHYFVQWEIGNNIIYEKAIHMAPDEDTTVVAVFDKNIVGKFLLR